MSEESQKKPGSQGTEELPCQPLDVLYARETELLSCLGHCCRVLFLPRRI